MASSKYREKSLRVYVCFLVQPNFNEIRKIKLYGIGAYVLKKNKLIKIQSSKNFSVTTIKKAKMHELRVYPSSIQELPERQLILDVVDNLRETFKCPVWADPMEKRRGSMKELYTDIDKSLHNSEFLVAVLAEEYSEVVDYEINKSFILIPENQIIIFVKTISPEFRNKEQQELITEIESRKGIKYLPYSSEKELSIVLYRELLKEIQGMYSRKHVPFFD